MQSILQFFRVHYVEVIEVAFILGSFIVSIFSNVKARRSEALSEIIGQVAEIVSQAESVLPNGFGDVKLGFVLRSVEKLCKAARVPFDKAKITEQVEKVLAAPCKNQSNKEV